MEENVVKGLIFFLNQRIYRTDFFVCFIEFFCFCGFLKFFISALIEITWKDSGEE